MATQPRNVVDIDTIKRMGKTKGALVSITVFFFICLLLIGLMEILTAWLDISHSVRVICGVVLSLALYGGLGLTFVAPNDFLVVERLSEFYSIKKGGPRLLCIPGLVDQIVKKGDYKAHKIVLYRDEKNNKIDFLDGSAPVKAEVWYRVNPKIIDAEMRWTYVLDDPEGRIEEVFDGSLRPTLQRKTIDEASGNLKDIASNIQIDQGIVDSLKEIGVLQEDTNGFILTDIGLTPEQEAIRNKKLEGKAEADKLVSLAEGYANGPLAIQAKIRKVSGNENFSIEQAMNLFREQTSFAAIKETGANITLVAPSMSGIVKTLDINQN